LVQGFFAKHTADVFLYFLYYYLKYDSNKKNINKNINKNIADI